jgi:hypothetical protein
VAKIFENYMKHKNWNIHEYRLATLMCGYETLSLTLMEEYRQGEDEVTADWERLHDEELHKLNSLPSIIRMISSRRVRWAGHVVQLGEKRNACKILV